MHIVWEYAVLRVYNHFPDSNTREERWALQAHGAVEHGAIQTDALELLNELGKSGWRVRFRGSGSGRIPDSKLLDAYVNETTTGRIIGEDEWLLERALEAERA